MQMIEEYLNDIYRDFKEYLKDATDLCKLKAVNYQGENIPDYNDINVQQFYLLRYMYAYSFEYKLIFEHILKSESNFKLIKIASIGCGNMIDYWALTEALKECNNSECRIEYKGIDCCNWSYRPLKRENDEMEFYKYNAKTIFQNIENLVSNIYFFPHSISEFDEETFDKICEAFSNKKIKEDTFYVVISLRANERNKEYDLYRGKKIAEAIKINEFYTDCNINEYNSLKKINDKNGIRGYDNNFIYPNEVIDDIGQLNKKCMKYKLCDNNCNDLLSRLPVLTVNNIYFQILKFKRRKRNDFKCE